MQISVKVEHPTTCNFPEHMQQAEDKVLIISLDIIYIQSFCTSYLLPPPKPIVWEYWVRPMTESVVLYLAITSQPKFLSLEFHFCWSFTSGKEVVFLYHLITLKKLNAIYILFPHASILPSQTKQKVKKVAVQI